MSGNVRVREVTLQNTNIQAPDAVARTLTLPSSNTTIIGTDTTDTITNKTITDSSNTVWANALKTATGAVVVDDSAAPVTGQGLLAANATSASWQPLLQNPTTTKGDLIVSDGTDLIRLPAGTDTQVLSANSATTSGLEYVDVNTLITTVSNVFSGYDGTAGLALSGTYQNIPIDTERIKDAGFVHGVGAANVTVNLDGVYKVVYNLNITKGGTGVAQVGARILLDGSPVAASEVSTGVAVQAPENTLFGTVVIDFTAGNVVSLQGAILSGDTVTTSADSSLTIYALTGLPGTTGPAGPDGDTTYQGAWQSQNYVVNDLVTFQGSTYVCIVNTTTSQDPTDSVYWDLVVPKGDDGSGTTFTVKNQGTVVPGGPHGSLNFLGSAVTVTDGGNGTADITVSLDDVLDDPRVIEVREGTATVLTATYQDIPMTVTRIKDSVVFDHTAPSATVTVLETGRYKVIARCSTNKITGNTRSTSEMRILKNGLEVVGSVGKMYNRQSPEGFDSTLTEAVLDLTANDTISIQARIETGNNVTTVANGTSLGIIKLETIKGDQGPQGPDGDISFQGDWVLANYSQNDVVRYTGNSYVCILGTDAQQDPTNTTYWALLAQKGDDGATGAGASVQVQDEGSGLGGFSTLNFTGGGITVTDQGGNVANVYVNFPSVITPSIAKYRTSSAVNVNGTNVVIDWDTNDILDATNYTLINGNTELQVTNAGTYEVYYSLVVTSAIQRGAINTRLEVDQGSVPGAAIGAYMRQSAGNDEGSVNYSTILTLTAGQTIRVVSSQEGGAGVISLIAGDSIFIVKRLDLPL